MRTALPPLLRGGTSDEPFVALVGATALGAGALATVAPGLMTRVFGVGTSRQSRLLLRLWGLGSARAGAELVAAENPVRARFLGLAAAADGTACLLAHHAGLPKRTTALLGLTFGAVAVAAAADLADEHGGEQGTAHRSGRARGEPPAAPIAPVGRTAARRPRPRRHLRWRSARHRRAQRDAATRSVPASSSGPAHS